MKKLGFILAVVCLMLASCNNDDANSNASQEEDAQKLEKMYQEIVALSQVNTTPCTDSKDWDFTAIGTKACGGPAKYILYSKKINTIDFLAKVKSYTEAEAAFNVKWGIFSTCDVPVPPDGIGCVDGKPTFLRNTAF
ncbi:hypothetical protein EYY60_15440 [Flavobacterium zhairuonense]|uniref:hypothetical protein n=1 Tax=Flavobacterium zhairuonense TaxID=2493631 RepID=UPI001052C445|nr:hypothetical protein [Flavobacterium zhairuonense]KAF2508521.1 hypothetical protein EYY60_15440 [Flavobacterium zhairuonense]